MAMLTVDCVRCPARKMTHDVRGHTSYYDNEKRHELLLQCRSCYKSAIWQVKERFGNHPVSEVVASTDSVEEFLIILGVVRPRGSVVEAPPHVPAELKLIFDEAAECISIGAWNASGAMFRKIIDQISKDRMNSAPGGPPADKRTRYNLKPRLAWLFTNNLLPKEVQALADAIREDANDGVHNAPLGEADAMDLQDFTVELLETLFTLPGRLKEAEARRAERRAGPPGTN
jgi:hypothetical protein